MHVCECVCACVSVCEGVLVSVIMCLVVFGHVCVCVCAPTAAASLCGDTSSDAGSVSKTTPTAPVSSSAPHLTCINLPYISGHGTLSS